jgi:hypothetical protein
MFFVSAGSARAIEVGIPVTVAMAANPAVWDKNIRRLVPEVLLVSTSVDFI